MMAVTTLLLILAAFLQMAVLRDKTLPDRPMAYHCRWVIAAGFVGLAARFLFVLLSGNTIQAPATSMLSISFIALGSIGVSMDRILHGPPSCREHHYDAI